MGKWAVFKWTFNKYLPTLIAEHWESMDWRKGSWAKGSKLCFASSAKGTPKQWENSSAWPDAENSRALIPSHSTCSYTWTCPLRKTGAVVSSSFSLQELFMSKLEFRGTCLLLQGVDPVLHVDAILGASVNTHKCLQYSLKSLSLVHNYVTGEIRIQTRELEKVSGKKFKLKHWFMFMPKML